MGRVFLPGLGFREPGTRLIAPVESRSAAGALTVRELVTTAEGTDVHYEVATEAALAGQESHPHELVVIRQHGREHELVDGVVALWFDDGVWRRRIRSKRVIPLSPGPAEVGVSLSGIGEWVAPATVDTFGGDADARELEASDTHDGITVTVHALSRWDDTLAVELGASTATPGVRIDGIGGSDNVRHGADALALRDRMGASYAERARRGHEWPSSATREGRDLAVFDVPPAETHGLSLVVPYVVVREPDEQATFPIPVTSPLAVDLGRYPMWILRSYDASSPDDPHQPLSGAALGVDIDLGGWNGDRRVLWPDQVLLDRRWRSLSRRPRHESRSPEPARELQVVVYGAELPARMSFVGAVVQVRGPWVIPLGAGPV